MIAARVSLTTGIRDGSTILCEPFELQHSGRVGANPELEALSRVRFSWKSAALHRVGLFRSAPFDEAGAVIVERQRQPHRDSR